jgi:hypothetical protein
MTAISDVTMEQVELSIGETPHLSTHSLVHGIPMDAENERAFVIGNGGSLTQHLAKGHFNLLKGETTYACNRIHHLYKDTDWRPTHWCIFDRSKSTHSTVDISYHLEMGYECLVRADIPRGGEALYWAKVFPNFIPHPECDHIDVDRNPTDKWHFPMFCKMGGSVYTSIQWAVARGHKKIYVIGCDLGYRGNKVNHFTPDYIDPDSHSIQSADLSNRNLKHSHRVCRESAKKYGVEIFNAGIGGDLGAYERVEFDSLF